ncbi:unnamed protein product [Arabidopsis lyrata]|uniref:Uncharacterized protein n=1 Tax=Arabidopsis lyrata subsp. lyrata TaxID=81972 RepID=D7LNG1_ARALL|nr:hypothetical protein ARALYDRAFT_905597 [Arabidopsis lyrata subsp. lyrata]CAH8267432.1 unnamed protein product [Arabidopsis lyrata]
MKQEVGHTYKLIASDAVFNKLAIIFNILLLGTLLPLWILRPEETEFIDLENFEISKVTFRGTMGFLALILASCYHSKCIHCFVSFMFDAAGLFDDTTERTYIEMAMFYGFLTLAFFSNESVRFRLGIFVSTS